MARNFEVRVEKMGATSWGLHVRNTGGSEIPELTVEVDGEPVDQHPAFVQNQPDRARVEEFEPGAALGYLLVAREESQEPPWDLRIVHTDADGVDHEYSATVG